MLVASDIVDMMERTEIPWDYTKEPSGSMNWDWVTKHFHASIYRQGIGLFDATILDLSNGVPRPLLNVTCMSFEDAQREIRGFIGKSYHRSLGYLEYAGDDAYTFEIGTGEEVNFAPLEGHEVTLEVSVRNPETGALPVREEVRGTLSVVNHLIELRMENSKTASIPPGVVLGMSGEAVTRLRDSLVPYSSNKRTVKGYKTSGCTGEPGFRSGTVIHSDAATFCPVHRV